jgi:hypothetical protein
MSLDLIHLSLPYKKGQAVLLEFHRKIKKNQQNVLHEGKKIPFATINSINKKKAKVSFSYIASKQQRAERESCKLIPKRRNFHSSSHKLFSSFAFAFWNLGL